ncbi:MAG: hypothetical protein ACJ73N_06575 [Bryobacteraceae bacterium]
MRVTAAKFAATFVAGFYMLFLIACIQILPLFPAEPKLGPVDQHVTHFIPPQFPLLLIVPAFLLDLLWQRTKYWSTLATAAVSAALFVASLVVVEYPFASLLMSPISQQFFRNQLSSFWRSAAIIFSPSFVLPDRLRSANFCRNADRDDPLYANNVVWDQSRRLA